MSASTSTLQFRHHTQQIPFTRPFVWLVMAWDDLLLHRSASLAYGVMVSLLGALILAYDRNPIYVAGAVVAFMLAGPIITAGLCELSRSRDHGEVSDFQSSLSALRVNRGHLMSFAQVLAGVTLLWFGVIAALLYLQTGTISPNLASTVGGDVLRQLSQDQVIAYSAALGILGVVVLALSVVTVPMIIEHHVDAGTAMRVSLDVVRHNFAAMIVWAALILTLVFVGFATSLWAMVVIFPLLGHATWCAYRDLVAQ
ncbi:MAG: putative membrane protein [Halioglobus sp.]|jgi:uncharacterized membrane protein